ncbi:MAG: type II toxin-antitoxin system RelE/ParE family toxin [Clostridia bacterium]|nr:type II toxin-antitoxin system RelE/ParE family toxin [Clostridia bacterium]
MDEPMIYTVEISENAAQMLVSHATFLGHISINAADELIQAFEDAASSLELLPKRCPFLTDENIPKNLYRYLIFEKRYMLIYKIIENVVYIDYVIDCRQDYGWLIK